MPKMNSIGKILLILAVGALHCVLAQLASAEVTSDFTFRDDISVRCILCNGAQNESEPTSPCSAKSESQVRVLVRTSEKDPWVTLSDYNTQQTSVTAPQALDRELETFCVDVFMDQFREALHPDAQTPIPDHSEGSEVQKESSSLSSISSGSTGDSSTTPPTEMVSDAVNDHDGYAVNLAIANKVQSLSGIKIGPDEDSGDGMPISGGLKPQIIPSAQSGTVALPGGRLAIGLELGEGEKITFTAFPLHASGIRIGQKGYPNFSAYFLGQKSGTQYKYAKNFFGYPGKSWIASGNHLAASLDPRFGNMPTRVTSVGDCAPRDNDTIADQPIFSPTGQFECFRVVLVAGLSLNKSGTFGIFHATATIVTRAFSKNGDRLLEPDRPEVVFAKLVSPLRKLKYAGGGEIAGFEPTLTADSRLLLVQVLQGRGGPGHSFLFNPSPWLSTGWTAPAEIAHMYRYQGQQFCTAPGVPLEACAGSDKTTLGEAYPVMKERIRDFEGRAIPEGRFHIFGYPWIDFDGRNIFFQAVRRSVFSMVGVDTGYRIFQVDGSPNIIRNYQRKNASPTKCEAEENNLCKGLTRTFAPGSATGFWGIYPDAPSLIFPFTGRRPLHFMFHTTPSLQGRGVSSYGEVSSYDAIDPDYLVSLHMNEPVIVRPHSGYNGIFSVFDVLTDRVPDASAHGHTAILQGGASFPQEFTGLDTPASANPGFLGRAVYFPPGSSARISNTPALAMARPRMTLEIAVKLLGPVSDTLSVVVKNDAWTLRLGEDGRPRVSLFIEGTEYTSGSIGKKLPVNVWQHLSFVYRPTGNRRFQFYLNGEEVIENNGESIQFTRLGAKVSKKVDDESQGLPEGSIDGSGSDILLGPMSSGGATGGRRARYLLDEFALSRVARPRGYASVAAYSREILPYIDQEGGKKLPMKLPLGLSKDDLRLPLAVSRLIEQGQFKNIAKIGEELFNDKALSSGKDGKSQGISCATCHLPEKGFADNRRFARGADGQLGGRNVPTLVNRAFATSQMLDARSANLVSQALVPIANPEEMNADLDVVADYLLDPKNGYFSRLENVFKVTLGGKATVDVQRQRILRALAISLATFESTIYAGNSLVDRIATGAEAAPSQRVLDGMKLFNGKARCSACHSGPNFSDELSHVTGVATEEDLGRGRLTGQSIDKGAFKTPTLRQLSDTGPFFHNGSAKTLEDVIDFYNKGGRKVDNLDPEMRELHLTDNEKNDLIFFLRALNGDVVSGGN